MTDITAYDRQPRQALDEVSAEARAAWATRYAVQDGAGPRAETLIERAASTLSAAGKPSTIRDVWMLLAQRAGDGRDADTGAAAALAGIAMGLRLG